MSTISTRTLAVDHNLPVFCPSICLQVYPDIFVSVWRSLLQLFLGSLLFPFPCGFHVRTCLVILDAGFLSVSTIHAHHLLLISSPAISWCVLSHKSMLPTVSGQRIWRILLRQLLIKVCAFLMVVLVVLHVSAPYSSTNFTI